MTQFVGVVIRKDGTVPFDAGCHPAVRDHILAHLKAQGHELEAIEGTNHVKIKNWNDAPRNHKLPLGGAAA